MSERDLHSTKDKKTLKDGELIEEIVFHYKASYVSDGDQRANSKIGNTYYSELLKRAEKSGSRENVDLFNTRFKEALKEMSVL